MIVKNINTRELEKLFNAYYSPVLLYSLTIVKNRDDAEDIVQQAFIGLWQKMGAADFHTSARAYLYKTVYHASLDFLKHEKVKKRHEAEVLHNADEMPDTYKNEEEDLYTKLEQAIETLPEQCRRIFRMSRFDGLKYKEIAAELAISEKTVENQMGKALKMLRGTLKNYYPLLLILLSL
ncbi:RNA polymerase sigma-70 factor [Emticicia sp. C21]|uniref:RNA polymerase sigma-70 factor n=1 Tax=Emticicia sp. C21 TaxID=2302915 RepID=UPI000E343452|nr:RNA polymerase sigma-70 factor [Emticicia sp. C21]RFS17025.1 RNA polymerase sigma-70 factor [Emticicia sp. C21]